MAHKRSSEEHPLTRWPIKAAPLGPDDLLHAMQEVVRTQSPSLLAMAQYGQP